MKVMLMSLAMVLMAVLVNAQGGRGENLTERAKIETEHLTQKLELTDKQAEKVEKINLEYAGKMTTMRNELKAKREAGEEIDRENMREQMKTMRETQVSEIKSVLTPTQIEKFDAMVEERKTQKKSSRKKANNGRDGNSAERAKRQTEHLTEKLDLTDKQAEKVEKINLEYAGKMAAMRDKLKAKRDAGEAVDRENARDQMKTMRDAQADEIKAVLTPTQIEKFDTLMEERKGQNKVRRQKEKEGKRGKSDN